MKSLHQRVRDWWYQPEGWTPAKLLAPLSAVYATLSSRRAQKGKALARKQPFSVPVVVVGNITAGGAGKTPFTIALTNHLQTGGLRVGVVSRGYGGAGRGDPVPVQADSNPATAGDEPVLIAQSCHCPVYVCADRVAAVTRLLECETVDLVICDDGLQHYRLSRDIEIALVDASAGFGNGHLIPAGPMRESPQRLTSVDYVVVNGDGDPQMHAQLSNLKLEVFGMRIRPTRWTRLSEVVDEPGVASNSSPPFQTPVHAVAGLANPDRFFSTLEELNIPYIPHRFDDHYSFRGTDLEFGDNLPVVMTAKDAVKCQSFAKQDHWVLHVEAVLDQSLLADLENTIRQLVTSKREA